MKINVIEVDYSDSRQTKDLVSLLNIYAQDPMGGGKVLDDYVVSNLIDELAKRPYAFSVLCYVDKAPVGLVNCFEAFSTFTCKPLVNIHDVIVIKEFRGQNINQRMLTKVEEIAKSKGCCKLTLEVLSKNEAARSSYTKFGFSGYELDQKMGTAQFWQKLI